MIKNFFYFFVIACIVLCIGLFCGYKYSELKLGNVMDKECNNNSDYVEVVDYVNYSIDKTGKKSVCGEEYGEETIIIPMLTTNKNGVADLNNAINFDLKGYILASKRSYEEAFEDEVSYSSSYNYMVIGDYIIIHIITSNVVNCGTGFKYDNYYVYNVKEDKYLTNDELLFLYNISKVDLKNKIKADIESMNDDNKMVFYDEIIDNLENDNYQAYINFSNELVLEFRYAFDDILVYNF